MSLNHLTDPDVYNPWMNINCNTIAANELDIDDLKTNKLTVVETETSTIRGSLGTGIPLLEIKNTSTTPSLFGVGLSVTNASMGGAIKLLSQNTSNDQAIWADGKLTISTFTAPGTITLTPNGIASLSVLDTGINVVGSLAVSDQSYLQLNLAAPVSIVSNTDTILTGLTTTSSAGSAITYNSGTGLFTVGLIGVYLISYTATWTSAALGSRAAYINPTGGSIALAYDGHDNVSTGIASNTGSTPLKLAAAAQFSIRVLQTSGAPLNLNNGYVIVTKLS